jgi:hypothetical protein
MSEVPKERKKKQKKSVVESDGAEAEILVSKDAKRRGNGASSAQETMVEGGSDTQEMKGSPKLKETKPKKGTTQKPSDPDSDSTSSSSSDHEGPRKSSKPKSKKAKAGETELVPTGENDGIGSAPGSSKGFMSKLHIWKKKKDHRGVEKLPSDIYQPNSVGEDHISPRGALQDKEEIDAIAELLKSPGVRKTGQNDSETNDMDAAAYLRSVVQPTSGGAGTTGSDAGTFSAPSPPMLARTNQNVTLEDLKTLASPHEPFSDSQAPLFASPSLGPNPAIRPLGNFAAASIHQSTVSIADAARTRAQTMTDEPLTDLPREEIAIDVSANGESNHRDGDTQGAGSISKAKHMTQTSDLGHFFYSRMQGGSVNAESLASERKKDEERLLKKKQRDLKEKDPEFMKFNKDDGRFKYKGNVMRIPIADEKKDTYEIYKFSHNAWSGVRYYWVPDGEGKLSYITGEVQYRGSWKKGVRHGTGEGSYDLKDVEGLYSGEWKNGKPGGQGKLITKRFQYEGAWKDGLRHGFGEYTKEHLHYVGDWIEDKKEGYGIATYADGTRYEGEWQNDSRYGFGVCRYPDGSIYTGMWKDNFRHGNGTSIYENGNRYVGEWYKDMKQGSGVLYGALHQKIYEGKWWRNKRHGQGVAWFLDSGDRYEGEWFLGQRHGEGDWFGSDGSSYKGSYVDGFRHGTGLVIYASGDRYVGEWIRGIREGSLCAYVYKDYGKFVGPFVGDRACGQGEYHTFANRKIAGFFETMVIEDEMGRYNGLTLNGKRFGRGTQTYANGDFYDGEWRDGMRTGYGVMQYEDGGRYVGFWMKDQRSKLGTYSLPSGEKYIGRWLKDMRCGIGTMIFENRDRLVDAQWQDDAPVDGTGYFVFANKAVYRGPLKNGLPNGRGSLTISIAILLRERADYRRKVGLHFFLRGERKSRKVDENQPVDDLEDANQEDDEDITAYVDSAKKDKRSKAVTIYQPNTITFWREFKSGVLQNGPGVSVWDGNAYEGDFIGFERCGIGRMTRTNGEMYYGEWKHDREWGLGELRTRSQDLYLGFWYNGYRNGVGSQSYDEGGTFYGKWMNDKRHGIGIFLWPDKSIHHREYYKGELVSKRDADQTWCRKQLASWGVENFAKRIQAMHYAFAEWSKGPSSLPDWYAELVQAVRAPAEDPSMDAIRSTSPELPHIPPL